jgi:hypothetical protein
MKLAHATQTQHGPRNYTELHDEGDSSSVRIPIASHSYQAVDRYCHVTLVQYLYYQCFYQTFTRYDPPGGA